MSKLYTRLILLIYVFNNYILIYDYVFLRSLKRKIIDEFKSENVEQYFKDIIKGDNPEFIIKKAVERMMSANALSKLASGPYVLPGPYFMPSSSAVFFLI